MIIIYEISNKFVLIYKYLHFKLFRNYNANFIFLFITIKKKLWNTCLKNFKQTIIKKFLFHRRIFYLKINQEIEQSIYKSKKSMTSITK